LFSREKAKDVPLSFSLGFYVSLHLCVKSITYDQIVQALLWNGLMKGQPMMTFQEPIAMRAAFVKHLQGFKIFLNATIDETWNVLTGEQLGSELGQKRA
jgi:hypothetical protein